jgi:hypothetical protein
MLGQQPGQHGGTTAVKATEEQQAMPGHLVGSADPALPSAGAGTSTSVRVCTATEMLTERAARPRRAGRAEYRPQMAVDQHTRGTPPSAPTRPRGAGERARMRFRTATRRARALPDFLILGGQRCGSTTLYEMLCGHPQVMAASHKEPHFFDNNHLRGEQFYRRLFPLVAHMRARRRLLGGRVVTGEATTHYLSHPAVPQRVARMLPDVALIAILRDPVERAYSHFQLAQRNGREPLSFERALAAEDERLAGEEQRLLDDPGYRGEAYNLQCYRTRGLYLGQLERWWQVVPEQRLLVLRSEDMFADPGVVYRQVTDFLELEPDDRRRGFAARNRVRYGAMRPATRAALRDFYAEPNRRLEQRLGRVMHWQAPDASQEG